MSSRALRHRVPTRKARYALAVLMLLSSLLVALPAGPASADHEATNDVPLDMEHHLPLVYLGDIRVFNFYWDADWDANNPAFQMADIDAMTEAMVNSDYLDNLAQYDVPDFTWGGSAQAADNLCGTGPNATISTVDLIVFIACITTLPGNGVPFPNPLEPVIYNIIVPTGTTINDTLDIDNDGTPEFSRVSCANYGAYHFLAGLPNVTIIPAGCADDATDLMTSISHEVVEAAHDPVPLAYWIDTSTATPGIIGYVESIPALLTAGEAADICEFSTLDAVPVEHDGVEMLLGSYWSNADNACVIGPDRVVLSSFTASNVPGGGTVLVDGVEHALPLMGVDALALREGTAIEFPEVVEVGGTRATRGASCPTEVTFPAPADAANPLPSDQVATFTCAYTLEYELTVSTSPAAAATGNATLTSGGWFSAGTVVPLAADQHVAATGGSRYDFRNWAVDGFASSASVTMNAPHDAVAFYQLQHAVSFEQSGIPAGTGWDVTVDGDVLAGPASVWVDSGESLTYQYEPTVADATDAGTRYVLDSTAPESPLTVNAPATVTGTYGTEYLLSVSTSGLGTTTTTVRNGAATIGTATDAAPATAWLPAGTALALDVDDPVYDGAGGVFFFEGFSPAPPATLDAPLGVVATYKSMAEKIDDALSGGGISGPGSDAVAAALATKFAGAQAAMAAGDYAAALDHLTAFINQVQAQSGKKIAATLAADLQLDAAAVFHEVLCQAVANGQLTAAEHADGYAFYAALVTSLGGTPLPDCSP